MLSIRYGLTFHCVTLKERYWYSLLSEVKESNGAIVTTSSDHVGLVRMMRETIYRHHATGATAKIDNR